LPLLPVARLFLHLHALSPWLEAISGQPCHGREPAGIKGGPEAQFNLGIRDIQAGVRPSLTLWSSRVKKSWMPDEMRHLRTYPWSGQAAIKSGSKAIAFCLPLRGSVSSTVPRAGGSSMLGLKSDPG
jgi:hypothetical protein